MENILLLWADKQFASKRKAKCNAYSKVLF